MGTCHIGCSGYAYDEWRGRFYPRELPTDAWLGRYAETFDTVEINNTFYGQPSERTVDRWAAAAPPGFRFAVKLHRYGTHNKKLKDPDDWLANSLRLYERLGARLGPILVQLPPNWGADPARLDGFLAAAPARHRWAIEVRDPSWLADEVTDVLRRHGAALVEHDLLEGHPRVVTTDWVYLRFHGPDRSRPYHGHYPHQALTAAARRISVHLEADRDVWVYFNNDVEAASTEDAQALRRYVERAT